MNVTPIDSLIDDAMRCVKCKAKIGQCDCWTKCVIKGCAWSYEKGTRCKNPEHEPK